MDVKELAEAPSQWIKEGTRFFNRCEKPTKDEYQQICRAVATGFAIMGVIGYVVKLVHIPIVRLLVGVSSSEATQAS